MKNLKTLEWIKWRRTITYNIAEIGSNIIFVFTRSNPSLCVANVVASTLISQHSITTLSNPANFCKALYINASAISIEVAYNGCGMIVENRFDRRNIPYPMTLPLCISLAIIPTELDSPFEY
ncbi:hypothetical protein DERF_007001 [Dermatophagoides farinae]|uniref:Uncharacterized protein n=1 Tax=Dermatophagoides farinae TaxID=6954 RepID=A0A922HZH9_DERFA|nr:hypothetical protein DERF_007001 [Dermatophagoides farinae]